MNWQTIETCPRDGTRVILGRQQDDEYDCSFVGEGYFLDAEEDGPDSMGHDGGFVDMHFDFFQCPRSFGSPQYRSKGIQPTHWQPLPPPPEQQTRDAQKDE